MTGASKTTKRGHVGATDHSRGSVPAEDELPLWLWLWFPPLVLVLALVLLAGDRELFLTAMESEQGVVENGTALMLVPAAVFGVLALRRRRALPAWWLGPWLSLLVAASVYIAGEEVSWGQHWFGWTTPDWLAAINDQNEANLHNTSTWFPSGQTTTLPHSIAIDNIRGRSHYPCRLRNVDSLLLREYIQRQ